MSEHPGSTVIPSAARMRPAALIASVFGIVLAACSPARQVAPTSAALSGPKGAFDSADTTLDAGGKNDRHGRPPTAAELLAGNGASGNPQAFRRWFGAPDSARREARGALWTFRLPGCAIVAVFTLDSANHPRLGALEALPRIPEDPVPQIDSCLETAARRANTAGLVESHKPVLRK